jgi:D-glycero-D-manno-heptose 1,7-bisphosphate phosphatase
MAGSFKLNRNVAVFLDRDGTICRDVHYMSRPEKFELLPGVAEGVRLLNGLDVKVIVATNQSGIARGYFTEDDLSRIHRRMKYDLYKKGARVDALYYCPHHPDDGCDCRKPKIGLFLRAEKDFKLDLKSCFMIGDRELDVKAGWNAGCTSILVPGPETENGIKADYFLSNFYEAAKLIEKILQSEAIVVKK